MDPRNPPGYAPGFSGRTAGAALQRANKRSKPSTERRGLRAKNQLRPAGKNRYPYGKYQAGDRA